MTCKVVMISGARRGIGAAIAQKLMADGWRVSLGVREGICPAWAEGLPGNNLLIAPYEATDRQAEERWAALTRKTFGQIDAVVSNAGVITSKSVIEAEEDEVRAMMEVNAFAPRRLVKAAWDDLTASGKGRVVIIASLSAKRVKSAASGSYSMSKYAVLALTNAIRHTGFDRGVRATALCPGLVATDMGLSVGQIPAEAMTQPSEIADLTAMLLGLSNEASIAELAVNCQDEDSY